MDVLNQATLFATKAYDGILADGTNLPFILHAMQTSAIVSTMTDDREVLAASLLYDVTINPKVKIKKIRKKFGERIAWLVLADKAKKKKKRRKNKKKASLENETEVERQEYVEFLQKSNSVGAKMIALADSLALLRAIYCKKAVVGDEIWDRLDPPNKTAQGDYFRKVWDATVSLKTYPAWQEFGALLEKVFGKAE